MDRFNHFFTNGFGCNPHQQRITAESITQNMIETIHREERCIYYLGRIISNLQKGGDYVDMKNSLMISFLDFTMFKDQPEFRSEYRFVNVRTGHVFSSKTGLIMVDLTQISLAEETDKANGLERWASFFKASSWGGIRHQGF